LAIKALAALVSFTVLGVSLYSTNNDLQLPIIQHALDPRLFPGDPFVGTLPNYISVLWHVLWVPFRVLPEMPLLLALTVVERVFWLHAAGRLARAMTDGNQIAELVVWCVCAFGIEPLVGFGTGLPDYFEHTSLAIACFMLALARTMEGKPTRAGVWLGLMGLCNIMHTLFGCALLLAGLAVASRLRADKRGLLRGAAVAFLLMSPALWMAVRAVTAHHIRPASFLQLLWFYYPHHFFPSTWSGHDWFILALALATVLALCAFGRVQRTIRLIIVGLSAGSLAFLGVAVVAEAVQSPFLVTLHLARAFDPWTCVAAVFMAASFTLFALAARRPLGAAAGAAGLVCSVFLWRFHRLMTEPFDLMFLAMVCAVTWIVSRQKPPRPMLAPLVPAFALMLLFSVFAATTPRPAGMASLQPRLRDEIDLAEWAKRDSPLDSVFLVDPEWGGFRSLARRSSFVTWKEGAAILWYQPFAREWVKRIRVLGVDPLSPAQRYPESRANMARAFASLDDDRVAELARHFDLRFWVVPARKPSALPVAYANSTYKALRLPAAPSP
jgi:uncharacterized membrane protein YhdT